MSGAAVAARPSSALRAPSPRWGRRGRLQDDGDGGSHPSLCPAAERSAPLSLSRGERVAGGRVRGESRCRVADPPRSARPLSARRLASAHFPRLAGAERPEAPDPPKRPLIPQAPPTKPLKIQVYPKNNPQLVRPLSNAPIITSGSRDGRRRPRHCARERAEPVRAIDVTVVSAGRASSLHVRGH